MLNMSEFAPGQTFDRTRAASGPGMVRTGAFAWSRGTGPGTPRRRRVQEKTRVQALPDLVPRKHRKWELHRLRGRDRAIDVNLPTIPWTRDQSAKPYCHACQSRAEIRARDKNGFAPSAASVFSGRAARCSPCRFGSDHLRRRCRRPPLSSTSAPVLWSTTFMERRTFPRSSIPSNLTLTSWPSLRTSDGCPKRRLAIWLM